MCFYRSVGLGSDYDGIESTPVGLEDASKYPALVSLPTQPIFCGTNLNIYRLRSFTSEDGPETSSLRSLEVISCACLRVLSGLRRSCRSRGHLLLLTSMISGKIYLIFSCRVSSPQYSQFSLCASVSTDVPPNLMCMPLFEDNHAAVYEA
jgi:hypothetical protein